MKNSLAGNVSFGAPGASPVDDLVDQYAERLADTPAAREALRTIITSALNDIAPDALPADVREAYLTLNAEAGSAAASRTPIRARTAIRSIPITFTKRNSKASASAGRGSADCSRRCAR